MSAKLAAAARHARLALAPEATLLEAITDAMAALAWPSATLLILGGPMQDAVFHTSILTPSRMRKFERIVSGWAIFAVEANVDGGLG